MNGSSWAIDGQKLKKKLNFSNIRIIIVYYIEMI